MKKIIVVESPAKIKTISKFLGKDYVIMSTQGHVKDLPPKRLGVTINGSIDIEYEFLDKKKKLVADICKQASTADEVFIAPDPDREGELIAWHVAEEVAKVTKKKTPLHRISFNEITKPAIEEALAHPHKINEDMVAAQQARRVLDRWVGYEISPVLWKKIARGLSAGRVQSVALRLICEREEAIKSFKPEEYWTVHLDFLADKEAQLKALLSKIGTKKADIDNETDAQAVKKQLADTKDFAITDIKESTRKKNPPPPFMTSTLQQSAYNALGFSVHKTMQLAQKLYEGIPLEDASTPVALISYMRTDSVRISDVAIKQVREFISKKFDKPYLPAKPNMYARKGKSQDAHEAVRPVDIERTPDSLARLLDKDLLKLYSLIWKRFVACQMTPSEFAQKQITIKGGKFECKASGSVLTFPGYSALYARADEDEVVEADADETTIPASLNKDSNIALKTVDPKQHFTQPPARFSEATLVKEMEKDGIGRPSTYATILKTIQARAYTELDQRKRFVPTDLGTTVTNFLVEHFPKLFSLNFTAEMEQDLDKVAQGDLERDKLLRTFYETFSSTLEKVEKKAPKKIVEATDIICPTCKAKNLVIRFGKTGPFLGCPGYPECSFTSNFERDESGTIKLVEQKSIDMACPKCGKPLRMVRGRFGPFISCSGYPECKYIHQEKAPFPCPMCGKDLVKRTFKGSSFWGCGGYPKCSYSIRGIITDDPCVKCGFAHTIKKNEQDESRSCPQCEKSEKK
ncbi:MAG: topoisomerase protein [candidate division TM6 bacterium GW2011_GWE2_41_16]|nr:MAG: topoisomerase protein [candidate division TM6 bacterium GW2011_GWE2_41_16]